MARGDGAGNYVSGKADEFRVSNIIRNDSWIAAEYATIKNQTTFISIGSEEGGGWQVWDNATQNPDTSSPWTWEFDFPNETCYYEFYSIAYDKSDNQENAPSTADAICYYRGNTAPTVDYKTPINGTTGVSPCPSVTCEAYVNDSDGDSLTITWATNSSGSWTNVNTTTTSANSTVSYNFSQFSNYSKTYYWRVYVDDGTENISETYHFTTEAISTSVDPISPYEQTSSPLALTATGDTCLDNVTLYYRYSSDNSSQYFNWSSTGDWENGTIHQVYIRENETGIGGYDDFEDYSAGALNGDWQERISSGRWTFAEYNGDMCLKHDGSASARSTAMTDQWGNLSNSTIQIKVTPIESDTNCYTISRVAYEKNTEHANADFYGYRNARAQSQTTIFEVDDGTWSSFDTGNDVDGTTYQKLMTILDGSNTKLYGKVWQTSSAEPNWDLTYTDSTNGGAEDGVVGVFAYEKGIFYVHEFWLTGGWSSGNHTTEWKDAGYPVSWDTINYTTDGVDAGNQDINITIQVSNDESTVIDQLAFDASNGTNQVDISSLANAQYIRIVSNFTTNNETKTAELVSYSINYNDWLEWDDASNPDTNGDDGWSWDFDFPEYTDTPLYYEFYSIGDKEGSTAETAPSAADAICYYNPPTNQAPSQSGESPTNTSTNICPIPALYVVCIDNDDNTMTATWWSNSTEETWTQFAINTSIGNNTNITQTNNNFSNYSVTYWWSINLTDGEDGWNNETYHFTTQTIETSVDTITPYEQTASSLQINATGDSCLGNVTLYYRYSSDNSTWWNSSWTYRKLLTIDHNQVPSDLTNFPILVNLTDANLSSKAQSDGDDIVFTNSTGTKLNHEIENYTSGTGTLVAWVNVTSLSSTSDTEIYMYYGNSTCSSQQNAADTWDSGYAMVHHLNEKPANDVAGHLDSTSNDNDGTPKNFGGTGGTTTDGVGIVAGCDHFDGSNDYVNTPYYHDNGVGTISLWVYRETSGGYDLFAGHHDGNNRRFLAGVWTGGTAAWYGFGDSYKTTESHGMTTGVWYQVVLTGDGSNAKYYVNNSVVGTLSSYSWNSGTSGNPFNIGGGLAGSWQYTDGMIDEVRISKVARNSSWINTSYNTIINTTTFVTSSSEEAWTKWNDATNPDTTHPWNWTFNYPNGTGYYEFYSIGKKNGSTDETAPNSADASCHYTAISVPTITINFSGNLSDKGGPCCIPPDDSPATDGECLDGYYTNDSRQHEDWMYINCTITNATTVWLNWLNETTWANWTYSLSNTAGDYWEINTSGNITNIVAGYNYSFNIVANGTGGSKTTWWNKTGPSGSRIRRYVQLNCTPTSDFIYSVFYPYWFSGSADRDRLHHDQADMSGTKDTSLLLFTTPTDTVVEINCGDVVFFWPDESICAESFTLQNIYYHYWFSSNDLGNQLFTVGWEKTRCQAGYFYTDSYTENRTNNKSNIVYDNGDPTYSNNYSLMVKSLETSSISFTDNDIYEILIRIKDGSQEPSIISNRSFTSFFIYNVPSDILDGTDNSTDTDSDSLSDHMELNTTYGTCTNPFLADTDNDGVTDHKEYMSGSDPNDYTDTIAWNYPPTQQNHKVLDSSTNHTLNATDVLVPPTSFWITINDAEGDKMNITIMENSSGWKTVNQTSGSGLSNGTYSFTNVSWITDYDKQYYISFNVSDGTGWTNQTYHFTTPIDTSVDTISPYEQTSSPLALTATGVSTLSNVTLWYRYSSDNSTWWNISWSYRKQLNLLNNLDDYQMKIIVGNNTGGNVTCNGHAQPDFDDIRFVNSTGNELPYWRENYTTDTNATFWVNNTYNDSIIWMYYGNNAVSTTSNGTTTWDYFLDWSVDHSSDFTNRENTNRYEIEYDNLDTIFNSSNGFRFMHYTTTTTRTINQYGVGAILGLLDATAECFSESSDYVYGGTWIDTDYTPQDQRHQLTVEKSDTSTISNSDTYFPDINAYHTWEMLVTSSLVTLTIDLGGSNGIQKLNYSSNTNIPTNNLTVLGYGSNHGSSDGGDNNFWLYDSTNKSIQWGAHNSGRSTLKTKNKWVAIGKYKSLEPSCSFGSEEAWTTWDNTSNPDTDYGDGGWNWTFNYPNDTGYYEFYSIGKKNGSTDETAPNSPDAICYYRGNTAPEISSPYPSNESTGISVNPTLNITVSDAHGDSMAITWYSNSSGSWIAFGTNGTSNGTYHQTNNNFSNYSITYYWNVSVNDGTTTNNSDIFWFTTQAINTSVNSISPYEQTSSPLALTATGPSDIDNVTLWYRYSSDNSSWGGTTQYFNWTSTQDWENGTTSQIYVRNGEVGIGNFTDFEDDTIGQVPPGWTAKIDGVWSVQSQSGGKALRRGTAGSGARRLCWYDGIGTISNCTIRAVMEEVSGTTSDEFLIVRADPAKNTESNTCDFYMSRNERSSTDLTIDEMDDGSLNNRATTGDAEGDTNWTHAIQIFGGSSTTIRAKAWNIGASEPDWEVSYTDTSVLNTTGYVGLMTYDDVVYYCHEFWVIGAWSTGNHTTGWKDATESVSWSTLNYTTDGVVANEQVVNITVQVSNDGSTVLDSMAWDASNGTNAKDISSLSNAQYLRIATNFTTDNETKTAELISYSISYNDSSTSWRKYTNGTNPDTTYPWNWSFNYPNSTGYYEFYSIGKKNGSTDETVPNSADASCLYDNVKPVSSVDTISPYTVTSSPRTINATASNGVSGVKNVTLWYTYSNDNASWWNASWTYRKKLTIDKDQVTADLTNFPVLVSITDSNLSSKAQSDGDDIVFTNATGTKLNHEIELFNSTSGELVAWVNVTSLSSSTDTEIYMYYGNSSCSSQENIAGTWDSNYVLVFHFEETTGLYNDSTAYFNNASAQLLHSQTATGVAGYCADFEESESNKVQIPTDTSLNLTNMTFEFWVDIETVTSDDTFTAKGSGAGDFNPYLRIGTDLGFRITDKISKAVNPSFVGFHYLVMEHDTTEDDIDIFKDGVEAAKPTNGTAITTSSNAFDLYIGWNEAWNTEYLDAILDEYRISNIARNDSWINATYNTINNPSTFLSSGSEEAWMQWDNNSNPDTAPPWSWNFDFPNGTGYYQFYSIATDNASNQEDSPNTADASCYYNPNIAPTINSYDLLDNTGSKINNDSLDVNNEYYFTVNITDENGWADIDYINITSWYDNGTENTMYNQSNNTGGNLNMFLQYENTTGTANYTMLWPDDEAELIPGNCSETIINSTTRIINISFKPLWQIRHSPCCGGWNATSGFNDLNSWNLEINVTDQGVESDTATSECGVYRYTSVDPAGNWVGVYAVIPGSNTNTNTVSVNYTSNYDFNMTIWFTENFTNESTGKIIIVANNVKILKDADINDDINDATGNITFTGIGEENKVDIFNISGTFTANGAYRNVNVQFNVKIPFGTPGRLYTAYMAVETTQDA
ncbi:protein of unknown function (DUF2341) [Thermoplasmatales archaeon SCGC AB-539-N05]|nr:protein of unknown function (DUF2341) [Thermoplasmatales archaeon SCGC AB-539-N05]